MQAHLEYFQIPINKMQCIQNYSSQPLSSPSYSSYSVVSYSVVSYSVVSYSIYSSYFIQRVPPGLTADDIAHAIAQAYGLDTVGVQLVPVNPIFRYGGVQHAAIVKAMGLDLESSVKVVYDLEAQAYFTLNQNHDAPPTPNPTPNGFIRKWRHALRGIVIQ